MQERVAMPDIVKAMHEHLSSASLENFWRRLSPARSLTACRFAEPLENYELDLEGHKLVAVNAWRTDTTRSSCLYVASIGLIVPVTPSTTAFIPILPRPTLRAGLSGFLRSTSSRP